MCPVQPSVGSSIYDANTGFTFFHLFIAVFLGILLGACLVTLALVFGSKCCRRRRKKQRQPITSLDTKDTIVKPQRSRQNSEAKYATLPHLRKENSVEQNHYVNPADLDMRLAAPYSSHYHAHTHSLGRRKQQKLTVSEARRKQDSLLGTNSLLRTSMQFEHLDSHEY